MNWNLKTFKLKIELKSLYRKKTEKNNWIIFGLKTENTSGEIAYEKINQLLNIKISLSNIDDTYCLKKQEDIPTKEEFLSYSTKQYLLCNCFCAFVSINYSIDSWLVIKADIFVIPLTIDWLEKQIFLFKWGS